MELVVVPQLAAAAVAAIVGGVALLIRGFAGYRAAARITGIGTSTISSLAVGEVRVCGVVEPAEVTLVSPLQSVRCVYYRSAIREPGRDDAAVFDEERAIGFRVRDTSGTIRVFPQGASFDVPIRFAESSGAFGERPAGLLIRVGGDTAVGEPSREAQIAALLTVHPAATMPGSSTGGAAWNIGGGFAQPAAAAAHRYSEARIEPGDVVTVVGQVLPFNQLDDPESADAAGLADAALGQGGDPEVGADLAAARAAGLLAPDAVTAWGNAAIPGFGIERPVSAPYLDPAARTLALGAPEDAAKARRIFEIAPSDLILAAAPGAPMTIALGPPGEAALRRESEFLLGLIGAALAIAAAIGLALMLQGGIG